MASTEGALEELSPVEAAAARGELPEWTRATPARLDHMKRVATSLLLVDPAALTGGALDVRPTRP